jgi:Protein of unknown function (DUF4230)
MTASSIKESNSVNQLLAAVIAILLGIILFLQTQASHVSAPSKTENPGSLIVHQVRDLSELSTATFEMDAVVPVSDKKFLAESKLLYIAHGSVRVGIDLSEFQPEQVQIEGEKITVMLPPLKILGSNLDLEHSSVYSYDRGFLGRGPDVIELQAQAQREALRKIESAADQSWLRQTAVERVQKTVGHLLNQVLRDRGYREIVVKVRFPVEEKSSDAVKSSDTL